MRATPAWLPPNPKKTAMRALLLHRIPTRPLVAALLATATLAVPGRARAQLLSETWEQGTTTKWVASSTVNTYNETGSAPVLRSSVTDGPTAACAGKYARETVATSGGRVFTKPGILLKENTDYCLMAFIRRNAAGQPYLGINFEPDAQTPGVGSSTTNECWLIGQAAFSNAATAGFYCPPGVNTIGGTPDTGAVPTATPAAWTWVRRGFRTPAFAAMPGRYAYVKYEHFCGSASCGGAQQTGITDGPDFDDIRLVEGVCPAAPPADMAPHTPCAGTTPVCVEGSAATNAKCMDCNADFGTAGATRACPTAAAPLCITTGADKGACRPPCDGDFGSAGAAACTETQPFCRPAGDPKATCKACNGDAGSGATEACAAAAPTCFTMGAKAGACGKCTSNADCGSAKPRCDVGTGACTDTCAIDAECGDKASGKVCASSKCADGCRGDTTLGNGCPTGKRCTSTDGTVGACVDAAPNDRDADGVPDDVEARLGLNPDSADTDGDGIFDGTELGPDPQKPLDSDGDGKIDANDTDDDGDGILTKDEISLTRGANLTDDVDGDGKKNWLDSDADGDGVLDGEDGASDRNANGKPDFLDAASPNGGNGNGNGGGADLRNDNGSLEGGGCTIGPDTPARGAGTVLAAAFGLTVLGAARRRRKSA